MSAAPALFEDIGPMGPFFAAKDWSKSGLGPPSSWSPQLQGYVDMVLRMPDPAILFWGPELVQVYNHGYSHIMGPRHPEYLGRTLRDCWPDTYDTVIPMMRDALAGKILEVKDALIPVTRFGFTEETYFTFSFVPLRNAAGEVEGLIQPISETTPVVLARRRLVTLNELAPRVGREADALTAAVTAFAANAADIPFARVYLGDDAGGALQVATSVGLDGAHPALAAAAAAVAATEEAQITDDVAGLVGDAALGPWPEPIRCAMILPLQRAPGAPVIGAIVLGISSRLRFDDTYRLFFENCARALASNLTFERENRRRDELTAELHRRAEALTELDRAKTAFFSNASHELRTPLTLMLGPIDDALADELPAAQRTRLELARRNGDRLFKLVNSLLDFSRIEARRTRATFAPTDLAALTADLASSFRSLVERAGLRLEVDAPPLPAPVWVDRELWEKIVLNLLSNAFKFTLAGVIGVSVRAAGDRVEIAIRDTGLGIPASEQERVFERFHRVEGTRGRSYEGSGIGLALVRELVTLHGGTIGVASALGRGTTFTIWLPLGTAHLPAEQLDATAGGATPAGPNVFLSEAETWLSAGTAPVAEVAPAAGGPRIVLADDNADMRVYLTRLLAPSYRVEAVTNGLEALAALAREPAELVVTDVMMPGLDGFGLLHALKSAPATQALPVILLSARAGEESRVEGLAAGADDYLPKPFPARELLARVAARLEIARLHHAMAARLEELVAERTAQLLESNRELESFSYSVSHDLRAPLRHILGFSQLLQRRIGGSLDETAARHLRTIAAAAERGGQLVDDLLAFSHLGRTEITRSRVNLNTLLASVREELAPEQGARAVVWSVAALPEVAGDPALLRLALRNLLSNALKYSRPRPTATITVTSRVLESGELVLSVGDNGVGFDMRYADKLFGVFQRLHSSEEFEGTGIGLALVRRIVSRHGGRTWAEGEVGAGATFHVTLPPA